MKAERDVDAFYAALFMQDKVGEKHSAVVSGVAEFGLFCELADLFVEGMIPAETLGEGVRYDKEQQRLVVGSSGKTFSVGDTLQIEVVNVDPLRRRITLGLAGAAARRGSSTWLTPEDLEQPRPVKAPSRKPLQRREPAPPPRRGSQPHPKSRRTQRRGARR